MISIEPIFFSKPPAEIESSWRDLQALSHRPNFQFDFEYLTAWTEHLRESWNPFVLVIKEDEAIKGLVPLMFSNEKRRGILPYRRIRFLGSTNTDFSVVLAAPENVGEVVRASFSWLFSGKLRWELLILDDLVEGNPAVETIKTWLDHNDVVYSQMEGKYYYLDLERPWEEIWQETSKSFVRRNTNLARNRITKAGNWKIVVNPSWETERLVTLAAPMHIERQSDLDRGSFFDVVEARTFLNSILEHFRNNGFFRSYWLQFEDKYIAYMFGFEEDEVFYAWNMAFDPEYSNFFPSKFLLLELVKDCHQRGLKEFNFMRGETEYKTKWTKHFRPNYRFTIKNTKSIYGKAISLMESILK